jgi:hypothetical protein
MNGPPISRRTRAHRRPGQPQTSGATPCARGHVSACGCASGHFGQRPLGRAPAGRRRYHAAVSEHEPAQPSDAGSQRRTTAIALERRAHVEGCSPSSCIRLTCLIWLPPIGGAITTRRRGRLGRRAAVSVGPRVDPVGAAPRTPPCSSNVFAPAGEPHVGHVRAEPASRRTMQLPFGSSSR